MNDYERFMTDVSDTFVSKAVFGSTGRLNRSPKKNWVESAWGLPKYIEDIANALHTKRGMPIGRAISVAVSRVKTWAAGGDNVDPDTRAKAAKALAQWEALRARSKAKSTAKDVAQ